MIALWFAFVSLMLIGYVILDGRNFWRGNAPLACREDAPGAAPGDCGNWAALDLA